MVLFYPLLHFPRVGAVFWGLLLSRKVGPVFVKLLRLCVGGTYTVRIYEIGIHQVFATRLWTGTGPVRTRTLHGLASVSSPCMLQPHVHTTPRSISYRTPLALGMPSNVQDYRCQTTRQPFRECTV